MESPGRLHAILLNLTSGAAIAGFLVAGLFFLKFWKASRDTLFLFFGAAFWVLAAQRLLLCLSTAATEDQAHLFSLRLLAYLLILAAIIQKNRREGASGPSTSSETKARP
jgi:hypothetical protein